MNQKQKAGTGITFGMTFVSGALRGKRYYNSYPYGIWEQYLDEYDSAFAHADAQEMDYVVYSSGIPLAWRLRDGSWRVTEGDYGKVYARHRCLVQGFVDFAEARVAHATTASV